MLAWLPVAVGIQLGAELKGTAERRCTREINAIFLHFRNKQTISEKKEMQKTLPNILPQISGILENVNRQMLLIFKTNDLIRGIEYTLHTNSRMGAFKVMSKCCINSVYNEKFEGAKSTVDKFKIKFAQYWILFKINVYYTMLSIGQIYNSVTILGQNPLLALE